MPETDEALDELVGHDDRDLRAQLLDLGHRVQQIVPRCVGVSLTLVRERLTLTLVSKRHDEPPPHPGAVGPDGGDDPLSEDLWSRDALADAAEGVLSTLSLPMRRGGEVVGGVTMYAATLEAFDGHHAELATALGALATDAVTNADLSFSSRAAARLAPATVADMRDIDVAVGTLAAWQSRDVEAVRDSLEEAARWGGISLVHAARLVLRLRRP
ncbi:MAG: GAF domain-containing protein [Nocardioides sp.]